MSSNTRRLPTRSLGTYENKWTRRRDIALAILAWLALIAVARKLLVLAKALIRDMVPYRAPANSVC